MRIFALIFFCLISISLNAQSVKTLYGHAKYKEITTRHAERPDLNPEEMVLIGHSFYMLNEEAKAISFYERAEAAGYRQPALFLLKGQAQRYMGGYPQAELSIRKYLSLEPTKAEGWFELGMILFIQNKVAAADSAFTICLKLDEPPSGAHYMSAHLELLIKGPEAALPRLKELAGSLSADDPFLPSVWNDISLAHYQLKNEKEAIASGLKALKLGHEDPLLLFRISRIFHQRLEEERADSLFLIAEKRFRAKQLPKEFMDEGYFPVAEFIVDFGMDAKIHVYQHFKQPTSVADKYYTIYVVQNGKERFFWVEFVPRLTISAVMYHLKEKVPGKGILAYDPNWRVPIIKVQELRAVITRVLTGELAPGIAPSGLEGEPGRGRRR